MNKVQPTTCQATSNLEISIPDTQGHNIVLYFYPKDASRPMNFFSCQTSNASHKPPSTSAINSNGNARLVLNFSCLVEISIPDTQGHNIVLYFYPKDATPGCTTEGQDFRDNHQAFLDANTIIFVRIILCAYPFGAPESTPGF
jgi:peroxiredoxin